MMKRFAIAALAAMGFALMSPGASIAATDQQNLVDEARITLDHLKTDKEFGTAKDLLRRARAVMIVPNLVRAGFFLGGSGGDGVMLARSANRTWTDPAFYTLASASFGLQIGIQSAEVVMIVESEKALRALEQDQFKFGAQAGISVVTLGSSAEADLSTALNAADIIVWSSSSGAYAGITLEGSIVKPRDSYNEGYYGRPIAVKSILNLNEGHNPGAESLKRALMSIAG